MIIRNVDLSKEHPFLQGGNLECIGMDYPMDDNASEKWRRPAVIVVPGGAYGMVSKREGQPVAMGFLDRGFQVFVLTYMVASQGVRYPEQLLEVASATDYVKKHADEFFVNPDEVFVVGFSAGGHLTGNLAIEYASVSQKAGVELDCKPTAVGLSYPVISKKHGHQGSYENLLNGYTEEAKEELLKTLNLNEAVTEDTPPAFLWATANDGAVPADNALRYALALADKGVEYEIHVYPRGNHGLSRGDLESSSWIKEDETRLRNWLDDCASFFRLYTKEKF